MTEQRGEAAIPSMEYLRDAVDRLRIAEAKIDAVRAVCATTVKVEGDPSVQRGWDEAMKSVLRVLDDAEQSEHWDGTTPLGGDSMDGK